LSFLESIQHTYPGVAVIIADDSREADVTRDNIARMNLDLVKYFQLPFDSGSAAGRNFLVNHVETPFVLICDDDLLMTEHTQIEALLADMESSGAEIVGGCHSEISGNCLGDWDMFYKDRIHRSSPTQEAEFTTLQLSPFHHQYLHTVQQRDGLVNSTHSPFCKEADMVDKLYLARTAFVAGHNQFDPFFKVAENWDFFYRAKLGRSYIRFCSNTKVVRQAACLSIDQEDRYARFKNREQTFLELFFKKHTPITRIELPEEVVNWVCDCSGNNCPEPNHCRVYSDKLEGSSTLVGGNEVVSAPVSYDVPTPYLQTPSVEGSEKPAHQHSLTGAMPRLPPQHPLPSGDNFMNAV
jgi:hypothetical protein